MPNIIRGTKGPLQQWFEQNFDPSTGFTYRQEFQGFDFNEMSRLSDYYTPLGVSASLRFQAGVATLTLTDATGNVVLDKWEVAEDEERPSIFENLVFLSYVNVAANPGRVVTMMRNALQNGDPDTSSWDVLATDTNFIAAANGANLTKLKEYFDDYNLGVTNFVRWKYRLRHTTNAPNRWEKNISDFNVGNGYTIAQLLAETQNSTLWVLPLPGRLAYKILNYVPPKNRPHYTYGALKTGSSEATAANNRVDIVTEYWIDQINTNLYPFI